MIKKTKSDGIIGGDTKSGNNHTGAVTQTDVESSFRVCQNLNRTLSITKQTNRRMSGIVTYPHVNPGFALRVRKCNRTSNNVFSFG